MPVDEMYVDEFDVMEHKAFDVQGKKYALLVFRRDNHWDYDIMVCSEFQKDDSDGYICNWEKCVALPTTPMEYFGLSDAEADRMIGEAIGKFL